MEWPIFAAVPYLFFVRYPFEIMYDICLKNDAGKRWTRFPDGGAVKGFVYASQAGVLEGAALYERLQRCYDREALYEFLHAADGNFSAVVRSGGRLVLVADRMRTYPLLYAVRDGAVTVTDVGMPESFRTGPAGCATVKNSPPLGVSTKMRHTSCLRPPA